MVLEQNCIAIRMYGSYGKACIVIVVEVNGILEEVRWKERPVDTAGSGLIVWGTTERGMAVPA